MVLKHLQPSQTIFRWILVLSCLAGLAAGTIDYAFPGLVPESFRKANEQAGIAHTIADLWIPLVVVGVPAFIAFLVSVIGLYLFKPWAPLLAVVTSALALVVYAFSDVAVVSNWASMLSEISSTLWGAVLALALFSPLRASFHLTAGAGAPPETDVHPLFESEVKGVPKDLARNLAEATRLMFFRRVDVREWSASPEQLVALTICGLSVNLVATYALNGRAGYFNVWALPHLLASLPLILLAGHVVGKRESSPASTLAISVAVMAVAIPMEILLWVTYWGVNSWKPGAWEGSPYAFYYGFVLWWTAVVAVTVFRAGTLGAGHRLATAAIATVLIVGPGLILPGGDHSQLWAASRNEEGRSSRNRYAVVSERAIYDHPAVLTRALAKIEKQRKGIVDLYFAGFAGDASQDVFMRETSSFAKLFRQRFDAEGRTIELINNRRTFSEYAIATHTALLQTLRHIGKTINREEDIVFLYMTSHGSKEHRFSVDFWPLRLDDIDPAMLKTAFEESGIKWRVIVISACYAGGFTEPLKDDFTLVITASDATHQSFGCSNEADFTYFGQAYFDALKQEYSFIDAFAAAKSTIERREKSEGKEPSNPQMLEGTQIRRKLEQFETRLKAKGHLNKL